MKHAKRFAGAVVVAVLATGAVALAGVDIKISFDKTYDFTKLKTYAWHPDGAGEIKMLELHGGDPVAMLEKFDPVFKDALTGEFAKRGMAAATGKPDFFVHYYVLIGPNSESQFRGQFLGAVPPWGLPDFAMTTTSFKIWEQGTIVLDVIDASKMEICWRGIAEAKIDRERTLPEREKRIRQGVADLLKKFPPKPQSK